MHTWYWPVGHCVVAPEASRGLHRIRLRAIERPSVRKEAAGMRVLEPRLIGNKGSGF
ncbi:hypothetical protein GCM10009504_03970 [Pseudomonas laurentiana]|nr:hypothetical protein GCM10009504_03970 [Pseudomonas laurentiana]